MFTNGDWDKTAANRLLVATRIAQSATNFSWAGPSNDFQSSIARWFCSNRSFQLAGPTDNAIGPVR
jgi:hypothetical protein